MHCFFSATLAATFVLSLPGLVHAAEGRGAEANDGIEISQDDWPWWRGPQRNGTAFSDQSPPLTWSETENVIWRAAVPGRGYGSATVVGERVFLATADRKRDVQTVLCFDRNSGSQLWATDVHQGGLTTKGNKKSTQASSSVACDGRQAYINFLNKDAVYTTALNLDGEVQWQTKISDYTVHQGYGSSPALYGGLVIVSADNKGGGAVAALDRNSGAIVWKHKRPAKPNYASPIVFHIAGKDQLLLTGCDLVTSLEPTSGKPLWEIDGATTECVTSTVTDGELIFTSGGYPKNHISAVRADGSGKVVWENKTRVYVPSMLIKDGYLYTVLDAGIAMCWDCQTGKEVWKHRLGGAFTSSPVLVGDTIFATSETGRTFVFKANPKAFKPLAENQLGTEGFATPAICGSRIYLRMAAGEGEGRQEMLYCLGKSK